jgi:hypothetical protein
MSETPIPRVLKPAVAAKKNAGKRKMRPGGGKSKGNGFEGTIAKKLTAALQPLNFMRTPGSGARVGGKNFETLGQMLGEDALKVFVGDVVPVNERKEGVTFRYVIECKSYATADNFTSLASGSANIFKWYEEIIIDAAKIVGKRPLLIFKWNHTPVFVACDTYGYDSENFIKPLFSLLSYDRPERKGRALDIFYLDDLLQHPAFWHSKAK